MKARRPFIMRGAFPSAFLLALTLSACFQTEDGACIIVDTCESRPPTTAELKVQVSPGAQSVAIYAGDNIETGRLVLLRESPEGDFSVSLPLGNYSAVARYSRGGQNILAVDADELGYDHREECEQDCYSPDDGVVMLTLSNP